ncbi:MAG: hypothetical protein ACLGHQ_06425 [Acidimicrobiia bacterium]
MDLASGRVIPLVVTACVVGTGGLLGQLLKHRIDGLRPREQLRAATYLTRFSTALEYAGIHRRELRRHVEALRSQLGESARKADLDAVVEQLGPPRSHAARVSAGSLAPSWLRGLVWLLLLAAVVVLANASFVAGVETAAGAGRTTTWSGPLSTTIEVTVDQAGEVSNVDLTAPAAIPVAAIVFLTGSRPWRLATRRTR